ncbi:hypothetical protein [Novipirellula artificiosorum]|uniref:Uncharacterized protein n=1 Tax=Novipirellula artificiosorum TaxID=2528016 RepID=A0A5C6DQG9_9BACT|nr:hypothetical protein [Novipirellula artificiosorum]TWU37029.1 hypothetical protein Poly41_31550 [Novipirellula artificiosorum]
MLSFALLPAIMTALGCQSRAHNDLYRQRMASEIRVLEDQLYDADYQNQVLRDQLQRAKSQAEASKRSVGGTVPAPEPRPHLAPDRQPSLDPSSLPDSIDMEDGFDAPLIDPGEAVPMDQLGNPFLDTEDVQGIDEEPVDELDAESEMLPLPPPIGEPEPPGKADTEVLPIEPGELLPPPNPGFEELPTPPGQIQLPDAVKSTQPNLIFPESLELHMGLSGGHRFDDSDEAQGSAESGTTDGLFLVVRALDRRGVTVDLNQFEIEGELTVVALDPTRDAGAARIGRWEFSAEEVANLVRSQPTSGLHIPVKWQDAKPAGDEVVVHIRLRSDEDEMRCEGRINTKESSKLAKWLPRSDEAAQR